jgi:tetratricopeptide (TPR) repeat protein
LLCFLACASIASAGEPTTGLRTQKGGTAYAIAPHAPGSAEAESALAQADASQRKDPQAAVMLSILADRHRAQHRIATAAQLYQRALAIFEETMGAQHPNVGTVAHKLGQLHRSQGAFAVAEPYYRRALAVFERSLGPDHANVLALLGEMATLYRTLNRFDEQERMTLRSLASAERTLGADHPVAVGILNELVGLYQMRGRYAEAETLAKKSLGSVERTLGAEHPSVAAILNELAGIYHLQKRLPEAERHYQRSIAVLEKGARRRSSRAGSCAEWARRPVPDAGQDQGSRCRNQSRLSRWRIRATGGKRSAPWSCSKGCASTWHRAGGAVPRRKPAARPFRRR